MEDIATGSTVSLMNWTQIQLLAAVMFISCCRGVNVNENTLPGEYSSRYNEEFERLTIFPDGTYNHFYKSPGSAEALDRGSWIYDKRTRMITLEHWVFYNSIWPDQLKDTTSLTVSVEGGCNEISIVIIEGASEYNLVKKMSHH